MHFCVLRKSSRWLPKMARKDFWQRMADGYTLWSKFDEITLRDKCIFGIYGEYQDGLQKWQENNFRQKWQMTADILGIKKLVKSALSCIVSKINVFLCFTQNIKMAAKTSRKIISSKERQMTLLIPSGQKFQ